MQKHLVQAFLGLIRSVEESDMRVFSSLITATLDTENAVHQSYLGKLGISREMIDQTPMCMNNESYTNYMISIGFKGGLAEIAAGYSEEQIQNLERIVELCSYYEYQFWDMAWNEGYEFKAELK